MQPSLRSQLVSHPVFKYPYRTVHIGLNLILVVAHFFTPLHVHIICTVTSMTLKTTVTLEVALASRTWRDPNMRHGADFTEPL
jgi:hypothetical protein